MLLAENFDGYLIELKTSQTFQFPWILFLSCLLYENQAGRFNDLSKADVFCNHILNLNVFCIYFIFNLNFIYSSETCLFSFHSKLKKINFEL